LGGDEKLRLDWQPGELDVKVAGHERALEVLSILVGTPKQSMERVVPAWVGDTAGLYWQVADAGPGWKRVALLAPPGDQDRRFRLMEIRFE
jgi:hypothetical protein